jgi:hypothetical protein
MKSMKTTQTQVAQASQPAVSQVSKPACHGLSTTDSNVLALIFPLGNSRHLPELVKYPGKVDAVAATPFPRQADTSWRGQPMDKGF